MNQHIYWGEFIETFCRSIPIVIDWETCRQAEILGSWGYRRCCGDAMQVFSGSQREQGMNSSVSPPLRGTYTWRIFGADTEEFPFCSLSGKAILPSETV